MLGQFILAVAAVASAEPSTSAPQAAANEWVALIDEQKWIDSWAAAGSLFRSQLTPSGWASAVQPVREPLGSVSSRKLQRETATKSLPGVPDGDYRIIEYRTSFARKAEAVETLILAQESSGWKVNGYFVR
jgi:hypothetical protein